MNITVTQVMQSTYFPMFAEHGEAMTVVTVECESYGEVTTLGLSRREDENDWYVDSRIGPQGQPVFVHGEGDRSCAKHVATDALLDAIQEAL